MHAQVVKLMGWLRANHPRDIVMPCRKNTKSPMYAHADGAWTWARVDKTPLVGVDVGVLLHDLCVVDVDDHDIAASLEGSFEELRRAPCERTRHGMHYLFVRSATADSDGYYDGKSQVVDGVDFKTRCHTGTRGFVVVAPSTGKTWVRAPWCAAPFAISDDLLTHVARARHASRDCTLISCLGDPPRAVALSCVCMCVRQVSEELPDEVVPVPFAACVLDDLAFICKHGMAPRLMSVDDASQVLSLADFLGVPRFALRAFKAGNHVHRMLDLTATWPDMAAALHAELLHRAGHDTTACVRRVDSLPDTRCAYDARWLFYRDHTRRPARVAREPRVPAPAEAWLRRYPGRLVLAGGGALASVVDIVDIVDFVDIACDDYDFFLICDDEREALGMIQELRRTARVICVTQHAMTVSVADHVFQVILRRYASKDHLLTSFDLQPCKVCVSVVDDALVAEATPSWHLSLSAMAMVVAPELWGAASVARVLKYACRGFRVYVPCTARECFREQLPQQGIGELFALEPSCARPYPAAAQVARLLRRRPRVATSDYDTTRQVAGMLWRWCARFMRGARVSTSVDAVPTAPRSSNFHPRALCWNALYGADWAKKYATAFFALNEPVHTLVSEL